MTGRTGHRPRTNRLLSSLPLWKRAATTTPLDKRVAKRRARGKVAKQARKMNRG